MGLKSLFFNDSGESEDSGAAKQEATPKKEGDFKFPEAAEETPVSFPKTTQKKSTPIKLESDGLEAFGASLDTHEVDSDEPTTLAKDGTNPFLEDTTKLYDSGLSKLNREGVEFYEFFQSVKVSVDNPQAYLMAFNMCKGVNPNLSKESMIEDADFYLSSIQDAYNHYKSSGENKLSETQSNKSEEEATLRSDIGNLEMQIAELSKTLSDKRGQLDSIGDKYQDIIQTVKLKLAANKTAMENLVGQINKVVTNIKNNL